METKRRKFQGVLNILSFNRHYYIFGCILLILICMSMIWLEWANSISVIIIMLIAYGLTTPLLVSAYIYDFSRYYELNWLNEYVINQNNHLKMANIHAGFDETSINLKDKLPNSKLHVFDFYNPKTHTEAAIKRARQVSLNHPDTKIISSGHIPLKSQSMDIVFLLSAVHEIRDNHEKIEFLMECKRICKPNGRIIMVEHLRDFPNFLAFSIGFTHFFSKKTWENVFEMAHLKKLSEKKFTPFLSIFNYQP